jgi:plasmid stabilization system protein ParE
LMDLVISSAAETEIVEASAWYFEHGGNEVLAARFITEVDRVLDLIVENPRLWREVEPGIRRALLSDFPYSLIYMIQPDHVFVLAVAHQSREAGYWRDRVSKG